MNQDDKNIIHDDDIIKGEDGFIFNPYNPLNVEITLSEVQSILTKYGVPNIVHNVNLYKRAFVHRSYTKRSQLENASQNITIVERPPDCMPLKTKSNERLEFLGDGILELVTKYYLYRRFPKENEGFMTEKKIAIVKNEAIGKIALEMRLNKWLILSKHAEEKKIRTNLKKLGCLFESFLGALFLNFNKIDVKDEEGWFKNIFVTGPGFQIAQKFVENIFEKHIDWIALIQNDDNYKNILQVDDVNKIIHNIDLVFCIGANDIINPYIDRDKKNPLYGIPKINLEKAKQIIIIKRSLQPGFSGLENQIFFEPNTKLILGNLKSILLKLIIEVREI
jgi:dsRNA-specific ribonuclease